LDGEWRSSNQAIKTIQSGRYYFRLSEFISEI